MDSEIQQLEKKIDKLVELVQKRLKDTPAGKFVRRSESVKELAQALAKAQKTYKRVVMDDTNTYSKIAFASLVKVTEATRDSLCDNDIAVVQNLFDHEDGSQVLHTMIIHNSGEFIESQFRLKPNGTDPHALTSYTNWAKRTAYGSLVGCPIPNEDDDAETYAATDRPLMAKGRAKSRKELSYDSISKLQLEELEYELENFPNIADQILDYYNLQNIADLPAEKYRVCITKTRELKIKFRQNES